MNVDFDNLKATLKLVEDFTAWLGGCDHDVNVCRCSEMRILENGKTSLDHLEKERANWKEALERIRDHFDMDGEGNKSLSRLYLDWKDLALEMADISKEAIEEVGA